MYGIAPDGNEIALIMIFGLVSFLLIFSYFAVALFLSTALDESGSALIYTMTIFIALSALVPMLATTTVTELVIGSQPELPQELVDQMQQSVNKSEVTSVSVTFTNKGNNGAWDAFNEKMQAYWEKRQMVHDTLALFSPTMNYESVTAAITKQYSGSAMVVGASGSTSTVSSFSVDSGGDAGIDGILATITANLIALLLFPTVFFGLAYLWFMRLDVR